MMVGGKQYATFQSQLPTNLSTYTYHSLDDAYAIINSIDPHKQNQSKYCIPSHPLCPQDLSHIGI